MYGGRWRLFVKEVYVSETVGPNRGERPLGRWRDRVKEYMCERGATRREGFEQAMRECLDRERWRLFGYGHTLRRCFWRE